MGVWKLHSQENLTWLRMFPSDKTLCFSQSNMRQLVIARQCMDVKFNFMHSFVASDRDRDMSQNSLRLASFMTNNTGPSTSQMIV